MNRVLIFIFSVFMFCGGRAVFAETTIKAEADKAVISTDELLTYKLTVASTEKNIPSPKISAFKGFSIVSQARSSSVSFKQGGMQTVLVFAFILLPRETGKLKIPPAQVTVLGKVFSSQSCEIEVKQGVARPKQEPGPEIPDSDQPRYNI